jgi:hypothetical protein
VKEKRWVPPWVAGSYDFMVEDKRWVPPLMTLSQKGEGEEVDSTSYDFMSNIRYAT